MSKEEPIRRKMPRNGETRFGTNERDRKYDALTVRINELENKIRVMEQVIAGDDLLRRIQQLESKVK